MSDDYIPKPRRRCQLILNCGGDDYDSMIKALEELVDDIKSGSEKGFIGRADASADFKLFDNPGQTRDKFFEDLENWKSSMNKRKDRRRGGNR